MNTREIAKNYIETDLACDSRAVSAIAQYGLSDVDRADLVERFGDDDADAIGQELVAECRRRRTEVIDVSLP